MSGDPAPISPAKRALVEKYLRTSLQARPNAEFRVPRRATAGQVPLSFAQEQVWLHAQLAPELPLYNEPVTIHYDGPLNVEAFENAFNEILRRHEAWRTSFIVVDGGPFQIIHPHVAVDIPFIDLTHIAAEKRDAEAVRIATIDAVEPLDFSQWPLFRAKLIRLAPERHRLYLTLSHIIFDGVDIYRVFLPELAALYKAYSAGMSSPLPELPFQYGDFAAWQRTSDLCERSSRDLGYWKHQLSGEIPTLDLPFDRPRPAVQSMRGSMYPWEIDAELLRALKGLCQREGVTLFQTLAAAFAILLQRYSGQTDVTIGTVTSGRDVPGTTKLLGCFLNTVVLRLDLSGDPTFGQLLRRVRNTTLEAIAHDTIPFGTLINELRVPRDPNRNPLFQCLFTLEPPMPELDAEWQLTQMDVDTGATRYDLYLELDERRDAILARYHYNTDVFDYSTIARMADEWTTLLRNIVAKPESRLQELPVLSDSQRRRILVEWNETKREYSSITVDSLFESQVRRTPEATAVEFKDQKLTYASLNARANQLARHLRALGAGRDVLVGLCVERSLDMIVGLLGILKARSAYVPMDPAHPTDRLQFITSDSTPLIVVTEEALRGNFPVVPHIVCLDTHRNWLQLYDEYNLEDRGTGTDLAYVIYTCGSTGRPKGVQVEHRSVLNLLMSMTRRPGLTSTDTLLAVTTIAFDIAALEIYLPLISGACAVIAPTDVARDGSRLKELLRQSKATVMQATPSMWRLLLECGWEGSSQLTALCGGEALPLDLARNLAMRVASAWNLYGPTETTIWSTLHRVEEMEPNTVPIGRPLDNTRIYILDSQLSPVPIGVKGEIHIAGDGVARGYLNRRELTEQRFMRDPYCETKGARMYRTGDLARFRADGTIEFVGRADTQIKLRGFRIELGEIEATLANHSSIKNAVAIVNNADSREPVLIAYVVPAGKQAPDAAELRTFLKQTLPDYMIPAQFLIVDRLPITPNGKIDRAALPKPLTTLLRAPTVAQLAEAIATPSIRDSRNWSSLVPLQPHGIAPPIFCIHGHFGEILFYRPLAKHLGERQPFYALQSIAVGSSRRAHSSIEEMADHYISEMRQARPHGPYFLAGYCFGALVAYEMAQRLHSVGEDIAFLGVFLGYEAGGNFAPQLWNRLCLHARQVRELGFKEKAGNLTSRVTTRVRSQMWRMAYHCGKTFLPADSKFFRNVPEMNRQAAKRYRPARYAGRMTVFLSGDIPPGFALDPKSDLHGMTAQAVDLHAVPGERYTMMQEPHVATLAAKLKSCLPALSGGTPIAT